MWLGATLGVLLITSGICEWQCPELNSRPAAECSCTLPHTLRCAGDHTALQVIGRHLREQRARNKNTVVSLLDCALRGVSTITTSSLGELVGVGLHGLVVSSGDIRRVQSGAFSSLGSTLVALGLPNNQLPMVPTESLTHLSKLDRLDLSNNKILSLDNNSFKGVLHNLTYLDLSDNQLTEISSEAFRPLYRLTVLKLRGNLLKVPALGALKSAEYLRDLDLSSNALEGPLAFNTIPPLKHLTTIQLAHNTFASIRKGALSGLTNLTHLNVHNNQIDVLEDYAFKHLNNLTHLDLSHNEIVAVSGASLAQLINLQRLDLSHNFLRSLSAEPFRSLDKLTDLLLHDNDISIIDDGALTKHKDLRRFTIEDNPLNCDCLMAGFARWIREANNLPQSDKSVAVCATPPHLEGALISRLSKNKLCDVDHAKDKNVDKSIFDGIDDVNYVEGRDGLQDDLYDEELDVPTEDDLPISDAKVRLQDTWFDEDEVHLSWTVTPLSTHRYRCTGVTISRKDSLPKHVACHRAPPANVVLRGLKIDPVEVYTFCVAFEEMDATDVPLSLVLGCGNPQTVRPRATFSIPVVTVPTVAVIHAVEEPELRVSEVRSNITEDGLLNVRVSITGLNPFKTKRLLENRYISNTCYIVLAVLRDGSLVAQKDTPCKPTLDISMQGFLQGPYDVCASISKFKADDMQPICVVPQVLSKLSISLSNLNLALVGMSLGLMFLVVGLVWFVRKMLKKPEQFEGRRCFQEAAVEELPRTSYVMLTATSKV